MLNLDLARQVFAFLSLSPPFLSIKKLFLLLLLLVSGVCVVWAPPALECGMHRRRPLEASFSVSTCAYVFVGCLHSVSYTWPRRAYLSFPDQFNPKESKKKKKRKKVSTFLSFFLVPSVVWLPPSLQGLYSAALCAMSISNCVFFPSSSFFHPFR